MRFSLFLFLVLISAVSEATNYYVDPSSTSSTQNGSLASPWKTLSQVQSNMNSFNPGDFIYFKKGQTFTGSLDIKRSGTATAPLTFSSYGTDPGMPVFTGAGATMILVSYQQYVVIDGIKIIDPTMNTTDHSIPANIKLAFYVDGSSFITIKNCDISLVGGGVNIQGSNNIVDKTSIQNLRMINNTPGGNDDYGAIPIIISGSNNTITNNFIKDGWGNSYDFLYDGGAIEVYGVANNNNKIMYNTAINCDGFMEIGYSNGGASNDNIVAYNKIINCGELVYISNSGTFATSVNNLQFYNNVIVNTVSQLTMPNTMIGMSSSSSTSNIISLKNNIFWLTTGIDVASPQKFTGSQMTHEDNIYHLGTGSILNYTGNTSELLTTAAIFSSTSGSDPLSWNYMPVTGSPAIDFGQNIGIQKDFVGNPVPVIPNAGILENASTPAPLTVTSTAGTINCNGGSTTVTVSASGGTTPYTGTGTHTVSAGTYSYTVTDAAGTVKTTSISISQPTAMVATVATGSILIFGGVTTATINATGGTSPYSYNLNGGAYQTANIFSNVPAGTQTINVKDAKGCIAVKTFTITQPAQFIVTTTPGSIACNGGSTTVTVSATGGTTPYTGTGTFTAVAGTRIFTVTDGAGTTINKTVTIAQPKKLTFSVATGTVLTYGGSTTASLTATGGTAPYTYKLNSGNYQTSPSFTNVLAGSYTGTVKDSKNCTVVRSFVITQPAQGAFKTSLVSKTNETCRNKKDGSINVSGSAGTLPYSFKIGNGTYGSVTSFNNLAPGTYIVSGKDAAGTVSTLTVTIAASQTSCTAGKESSEIQGNNLKTQEPDAIDVLRITAFPNPSATQFSLVVESLSEKDIHIIVVNVNDQKVYETTTRSRKLNNFGNAFTPGIYFVKVIQDKNVQIIKLVKTN